ncbi:transposase [Actinoplanes sichuanensis]|uniref:Transposase n=1 Tax=Actinoplanes sichuanensis TaxID=512349 RepID=A0ABW4ARE4_9ACTN
MARKNSYRPTAITRGSPTARSPWCRPKPSTGSTRSSSRSDRRPLAHLPSGRFSANDAWLTCAAIAHNLTRAAGHLAAGANATARTASIRTRIINVAARLAHRARTVHLHLPERWPWQTAFENLFTEVQATPA